MSRPRHILFAPGAIERHTSAQRRALLRWLKRAAATMAAATAVGLLAGLFSGARAADRWTGPDKQLHLAGGAAIAAAVTAATGDEVKGFWVGVGVGLAKEVADEHRYGGASAKDALVTAIGALLGAKFSGWALTPTGFTHTRRLNIF